MPQIRDRIWQKLSYAELTKVRGTCRKFHDEIDDSVGIQLYLTDVNEDSLRLVLTACIKRLVIVQIEMSTLGTLIPAHPEKLVDLKIQGPVSPDVLHEVLRRCSNIQTLEIRHKPDSCDKEVSTKSDELMWGSLQGWQVGKLFASESEIRYAYGCFSKLRHFRFITKDNELTVMQNLFTFGVLPLLQCIQSPYLKTIDIRTYVSEENSKLLTETIFDLLLRSRALTELRIHHIPSEHYAFEPIQNVDQDFYRASSYKLKFGEPRLLPQLEVLDLDMPQHIYGYFDWITVLQGQRRLKQLLWDVGGNYFGYPIDSIRLSAKTLENLTLRMLRCYRKVNMETDEKPEFFSVEPLHEFIALRQLHLVSMELSTSRFSRLDLLPKSIHCLQIECFQVLPEQLITIHRTLPGLRLFSLSHWSDTLSNFMRSLSVIMEIINGHDGKYRGLSFLEKCMYTSIEELNEINNLLGRIRDICNSNNLVVDNVSGDNGIGFILVIGSQ